MFPHHLRTRKARASAPRKIDRAHRVGGGFTGSVVRIAIYTSVLIAVSLGGMAFLPFIPTQFNILTPLDPVAPGSPLSKMKIAKAVATPAQCLSVLEGLTDARYTRLQDRRVSEQCHIDGHVEVRGLGQAQLAPVSTSCETALRLYLWERHDLQAAAQAYLGSTVTEIGHASSYSCRRIRTENGEGTGMSAHATASAIDITYVTLADGRRLDLLTGWDNTNASVRAFWRSARNGACTWFGTVLGPDFNSLHADHFHLGAERWSTCR